VGTVITKKKFDQARLFIASDIGREVSLAKATETRLGRRRLTAAGVRLGGGNFLAALGLLCYTEFGGWLRFDERRKDRKPACGRNFDRFLAYMGKDYRAFGRRYRRLYSIFRCGLAHEYFTKLAGCRIAMIDDGSMMLGLGYDRRTRLYTLNVERYQQDLLAAFDRLRDELEFPIRRT
jgi:hypothetical protein